MAERRHDVGTTDPESSEQLAIFNETFARFNSTIKKLNESYATLQSRYQKLSDELTATNERLRESLEENIRTRNFLESTLESLTAGVITVDLKGKINSINKAGCAILQISPQQILGKEYQRLFQKSLSRIHSLCAVLDGEEPHRNVEKEVLVGKDRIVPISSSSAPLIDSRGGMFGALEIFVDLTEFKRMEEEIARVKSLAALGEVAAVIAHEVRNPLSGIAGFAALLGDELGREHPQASYVEKIISGVEKLNRSLNSLLEYARDLKHEPRPGELNALLKETVDFFRVDLNTRGSDASVRLLLPPQPILCNFDPQNLTGALVNLLKNADEAMPAGGTITVGLAGDRKEARISVSDEGTGVPENLKDRVFAPFFTTREGGTGLGLALVKKVVDAHKGSVLVRANDGVGSTFTITLPVAQQR